MEYVYFYVCVYIFNMIFMWVKLNISVQVIEELRCEIERLRTAEETARKRSPSVDPQTAQTAELQATIRQLREENKSRFNSITETRCFKN